MYQLQNDLISLVLDERGGLKSIRHANGMCVEFAADELQLETDFGLFSSLDARSSSVTETETSIMFQFDADAYRLQLEYVLNSGDAFFRRYIEINNPTALSLYRLAARHDFTDAPLAVIDYNTFWNCPTVGYIRMTDGGLFTGFEHPYFEVRGDRSRVETAFEPSLVLRPGEGYRSEANFFGIYRNTGRMLEQQTPPTSMRYNDVHHTRYRNPCGHIPLDYAEVYGFQAYARAYLELRVDHFKLIFYQFFITLPQQPDTDEDEALYYHYIDNFVRMGGDLVTFNPLVWHTPPTPSDDGHWELAPSGSRAERILNYARNKGLDIGFYMGSAAGNSAYCTSAMTPFGYENQSHWKKRDRNGHCASENCMASDEFAEWFYKVQRNTIEKYNVTLWSWDPGPGNGFFCYSTDHGHLPGKGAYKGFRNAMNVVKRLKQEFPRLYIQGFHGTKEYGLWGFRGFDQHECYWEQDPYCQGCIYPDFSEDRLTAGGMRFQSAWNQLFRFMPPEINHALASRMTQYCLMPKDLRYLYDQLGWKYAFFSSLAVGASMTVTMIPYDLDAISHGEYLEYYRKWIPWARKNFEYARYSKPFGAQVACGAMDGCARVKGDHGFLFLFNPGPVEVAASFELGDEIGLYQPGEYQLTQLYPMEGVPLYDAVSSCDRFVFESRVHLNLAPFSCTLLELSRAQPNDQPRWCNLPGQLCIVDGCAEITGCTGPEGSVHTGYITCANKIRCVEVNGQSLPFDRVGDVISVSLCFGAQPWVSTLSDWHADGQPFSPIRHPACGARSLETRFSLPSAVAKRLAEFVPQDEADQMRIIKEVGEILHRQNYAWAQPHRLHLMLPFAYPDHVRGLRAELNRQPVALKLVESWHDGIQARILYFADVTDQVRWDAENQLVLHIDGMDADSFLGARLDFPEGSLTAQVSACAPLEMPVSSHPLGMPRPLRLPASGSRKPVVESAWVVDGIIEENHPYVLCASVNLPHDQLEGVYASAQISIDAHSGPSLRSDQRLEYDPETGLWKRALLPGSRRLLIFDGKDIHVWAVAADGVVSEPVRVPAEWHLQGF